MARPKGSATNNPSMGGTVARPTTPERELVCAACTHTIRLRINEDPDHGDGWPRHRCAATGRAAVFTSWREPDPITVRSLPPEIERLIR